MPSPFPGMDPYLEHPEIFFDFHDSFIAYLREALQPQLPEPYYAALGRRAWIEVSERFIGPDVDVLKPAPRLEYRKEPSGSVAIAGRSVDEPVVIHVPHDERAEPFIEIYVGRGMDKRLVTSIELLSLSNKTPGEHGRDLYLRKQREILQARVHLVELDLLRAGHHTTAVPQPWLSAAIGQFDYHVCTHHFDNLEDYFVYPVQLDQPLPKISIPLLPGDPAAPLDLQAVLDRTYNAGPYHREIDYRQQPLPPLPGRHAQWTNLLLQEKGLLP